MTKMNYCRSEETSFISSESEETIESLTQALRKLSKDNGRLRKDNNELVRNNDKLEQENNQMRILISKLAQKNMTPEVYEALFQNLKINIISSLQSNLSALITDTVTLSVENTKLAKLAKPDPDHISPDQLKKKHLSRTPTRDLPGHSPTI